MAAILLQTQLTQNRTSYIEEDIGKESLDYHTNGQKVRVESLRRLTDGKFSKICKQVSTF